MNEKKQNLLTDEDLNNVTGGVGGPNKAPKFAVYDQVRIRVNGNMGFVANVISEKKGYFYELNDIQGKWREDELERA